MIAPVRVARSTISCGLKRSWQYHSASARTSRPSASVLSTSIVWPDIERTMSPGRCAVPDGMFSTSPTMPTALTLALRAPSRRISPITTPAPAMSHFMSPMPAAGLIEMPPVSKVTPLPTKASGAAAGGSAAMLHDDETRRPHAALRDAEQRAHAELAHAVLVENLDREAEFGEARRRCSASVSG